jgi:ketosteroid isomerase-like protein
MWQGVLTLAVLAFSAGAQGPAPQVAGDGRDADRAAIRAHIEKICQAFIDGDIETIHATHTEDWRGFLETSRTPIKGIDAYMRANGIPWPPPAGQARPPSRPADPTRTFKVFDFDVHFYADDLAVVNFFVDFGNTANGEFKVGTRYRIMDVYVRRNGAWNQAASHTVVDPVWKNTQMTQVSTLPPPVRQQLLDAREAVWRAYFTNDQATLAKLVPEDTVVLQGNPDKPIVRQAEILENARRAAERGSKLVRLEFPVTEIQVYGLVAIVYTTYVYELEAPGGSRQTSQGSATEVFVRRANGWVNPGWHMAAFGGNR